MDGGGPGREVRLLLQPALEHPTPVIEYEPDTWGPAEADRIIDARGGWHDPQPTPAAKTATDTETG